MTVLTVHWTNKCDLICYVCSDKFHFILRTHSRGFVQHNYSVCVAYLLSEAWLKYMSEVRVTVQVHTLVPHGCSDTCYFIYLLTFLVNNGFHGAQNKRSGCLNAYAWYCGPKSKLILRNKSPGFALVTNFITPYKRRDFETINF